MDWLYTKTMTTITGVKQLHHKIRLNYQNLISTFVIHHRSNKKNHSRNSPMNINVVPGLWKVPRLEEEGEGSSRSGLDEGSWIANQHIFDVEPTSLRSARLPKPQRGPLSGAPETFCPVWRSTGEEWPHLQVRICRFTLPSTLIGQRVFFLILEETGFVGNRH